MRLGDLDALKDRFRKRIKWLEKDVHDQYSLGLFHGCEYDADLINEIPTIDAVPVTEIKAYLQKRLDEWNALGDRKFEPANMWGYNFIMACFDDLERREGDG